jgi:hypothetical protein
MSSRPVLIAGFVGGVVAGVALFALALVLVAIGGTALGGPMMALLVLGTVMGFVLDSAWLSVAVCRLAKLDAGGGGEEDEGGKGRGRPGPDPAPPSPPSEDPEWWPEFERELRAYLEADERTPVAS